MGETNNPPQATTLWDHLSIIIRWRRTVILIMSAVAVLAVLYAFLARKWYYSEAMVLPPPANTFGLGNFLPQLNLGLFGATGMLSNEVNLVLNVLESRRMKDLVIDRFDWMDRFPLKTRIKAYARYRKKIKWEVTEEGAIHIWITEVDPQLAANTINFIVAETAREYNRITVSQARNQREFLEKRLLQNKRDLEIAEEALKVFQQETGVIAPEDQIRASVEALASIKTELIMAEVEYEVLSSTLPPNSSEVLQAEEKKNSLAQKYEQLKKSSGKHDIIIGLDVAPEVSIRYLQLYREIELQGKILEFLLPQYEQARIAESREKGNLYVLDAGRVPEKKYKPKRAFVVLAILFISFVILYLIISFLEWYQWLRERDPEKYSLVRGVLVGLQPRNLFRWHSGERP